MPGCGYVDAGEPAQKRIIGIASGILVLQVRSCVQRVL